MSKIKTLIVWEISPGVTFSEKSVKTHVGPIERRQVTDQDLKDYPKLATFVTSVNKLKKPRSINSLPHDLKTLLEQWHTEREVFKITARRMSALTENMVNLNGKIWDACQREGIDINSLGMNPDEIFETKES